MNKQFISIFNVAIPGIVGSSPVPVRIQVFDIRGRLLATLADKERGAGYYELIKIKRINKVRNTFERKSKGIRKKRYVRTIFKDPI
jgi:hypothetical protein